MLDKKSREGVKALLSLSLLCSSSMVFAADYPVVQMLKGNASSYAIDGNNGSADGQDVYLWSENENNLNQQWYEIDRGDGYYSYQKVDTEHCLDGNGGGDNGQNVYLWSCSDNNYNQHWLKVDLGDGYFRLEKRNASGYSIDGNKGGENRQSIYLWQSNDNNQNQQWYFNYLTETEAPVIDTVFDDGSSHNSYPAENVIDGDIDFASRWAANGSPVNLTIQLEQATLLKELGIAWGRGDQRSYTFEVYARSGTSGDWTKVFDDKSSGSTAEIEFFDITDIVAQQIRIKTFENSAGTDWTDITEVSLIRDSQDNGEYSPAHTYVGGDGTVAGALSVSCETPAGFTVVDSLSEMISAMQSSNVKVALAPGNYSVDADDVALFTTQTLPNEQTASTLFPVNGANSQYDFRCAYIDYDTQLWQEFGGNEVIQLRTVGNENIISNLTIEDIGDTSPSGGALGIMMDGRDNVIEGLVITSRGSQPYGLGDAYGKGGGPVLSHQKHSSVLIRGLRNSFIQSTVYNYSYGHSVFMQGSDDTLIDGIYVQGELRSTADMLAANNPLYAAADARAEGVGFITVWGYKLPTGYWMSLQEAGIRAYNGGNTIVDGVVYYRGANDVTVLNSVVRHTRTGVTLVHATGTKYVENTTVLGCEQGYSIGSGDIVNSYADANVGPVITFAYSSDNGTTADITVLETDGAKNGWGAVAFIGGKNHNITLRSEEGTVNSDLQVVVSGDKHSIRHLEDSLQNQDQLTLTNSVVNNLTNFPMLINDLASGNSGQSNGPISGNSEGNSIKQN